MLVVVDTNLFISALLKPISNTGIILENVFNNTLSLALSNQQFLEIEKSFNYPKIRKSIVFTSQELTTHIAELKTLGQFFDITNIDIPIKCRDENDNHLLATLIVSNAACLITGDKDLLCLADEYSIVTPAYFADKYLQF